MMLNSKEAWCSCFTTLFVLAVTPLLVEGVIQEQMYKLSLSNCNFTDSFIPNPVKSLVACALRCTHSTLCQSFAWREGECGELDRCPQCCNQGTGGLEDWNVFCTKGMTYIEFYLVWQEKSFITKFRLQFVTQYNNKHINIRYLK